MAAMTHQYDDAVLSFGAGVNSTALAILLVNEGWRGQIVFADTGCEWPDTYCFMDYFEAQWLRPRGFEIVRLGQEWRAPSYAASVIEHCERHNTIPMAHPRWCTSNFKVRPLHRWMTANKMTPETELIGIALEESWRMPSRARPLVERRIDRDACVHIIQTEGLDVPRKSGCYICPFQRDSQWHELWQRYPELYARAERLEQSRKARRARITTLDIAGKTTLTARRQRYEAQMPLLDPLDMDELLEYRPCICMT